MRKEDHFIWLFARGFRDTLDLKSIELFLRQELKWKYIIDTAQEEGVACLIYNRIKENSLEHFLPEYALNHLETIYYSHSAHNTLIYEEFQLVAAALKKESISFIPLKGLILAANVYKNIALRPMKDLDFLVKKEDIKSSVRIFKNLGYHLLLDLDKTLINPYAYSITLTKENAGNASFFSIDLHWHIFNSSWMMGLLAKETDSGQIWADARSGVIDGINTLVLSPQLLLVYLCLNAFNHGFARLIMLVDIDLVLEKYKDEIDLDQVKALAQFFGLLNVLDTVLGLAQGQEDSAFRCYQQLKRLSFYGLPVLLYIATVKGIFAKTRSATRLSIIITYLLCMRLGHKNT